MNLSIMRIIVLFTYWLTSFSIVAQCEDYRYLRNQFLTEVETVTYSDVTGWYMDVYSPVNDTVSNKPLLFMAHGGGFYQNSGDLRSQYMVEFCQDMAAKGFVCASIEYSQGPVTEVLDSIGNLTAALIAMSDAKAAIRFMRKSFTLGNPYGIDTGAIFMGGASAGAIMSLHLGLVQESDYIEPYIQAIIDSLGGIEGNGGNSGYSSIPNGIVSIAGAINKLSWIDGNEPPTLLIHGDQDPTVPYDCNVVFWNDPLGPFLTSQISLCGGGAINDAMDLTGTEHEFIGIPGGGHSPSFIYANSFRYDAADATAEFIFERSFCGQNNTLGCTDPCAPNYDPLATLNDNSCEIYARDCYDGIPCSDEYYSFEICDCVYDYDNCATAGCTDPCAPNFDAGATTDSGFCEAYDTSCDDGILCTIDFYDYSSCNCVHNDINCAYYGCIDPCAPNFNVYATISDESCESYNTACNDNNPCTKDSYNTASCNCENDIIEDCDPNIADIPTLSQWGLFIFFLMMITMGIITSINLVQNTLSNS